MGTDPVLNSKAEFGLSNQQYKRKGKKSEMEYVRQVVMRLLLVKTILRYFLLILYVLFLSTLLSFLKLMSQLQSAE